MALIDIIKCESDGSNFCQKFPSDDLRIGSQLVVYTAQTAFFVKGGKICDEFLAGTYTIKTANITARTATISITHKRVVVLIELSNKFVISLPP